jgi:hypothetical protein
MTRDDIIRLAREAGFVRVVATHTDGSLTTTVAPIEELERFAALIAAAERDRMKSEGWRQCAAGQRTTQYCDLLELAVANEREAILKLTDSLGWIDSAAIRARGNE